VWNLQISQNFDLILDSDDVFVISIDGTHCRINEPRGEPSAKWFSKKFSQAGLSYELGIAIRSNQLVWVNGPFPASEHDITIYRKEGGLKARIPEGKRLVGDEGYKGESQTISTRNALDSPIVKSFKRRTRARHETFNGRLKNFKILAERFRHGVAKHKAVFETACVIVQYDMENGHPMFDV
jgi:hypothetical protein